jgi:hypothetical protein
MVDFKLGSTQSQNRIHYSMMLRCAGEENGEKKIVRAGVCRIDTRKSLNMMFHPIENIRGWSTFPLWEGESE